MTTSEKVNAVSFGSRFLLILMVLICGAFFLSPLDYAEGGQPPTSSGGQPPTSSGGQPSSSSSGGISISFENPLAFGSLSCFLVAIIDIIIAIAVPILILMVVYAGFLFVTAQGNETKVTQAKKALLYILIGAAVILGAKVIALTVESTINALQPGSAGSSIEGCN